MSHASTHDQSLPASSLAAIEHTIRTHRITRQVLKPSDGIIVDILGIVLMIGGIAAWFDMAWLLHKATTTPITLDELNFLPLSGLFAAAGIFIGVKLLLRHLRWNIPFGDFPSWRAICGPLPTLFYLSTAYQAYICVRRADTESGRTARRLRRWVADYLFCPLAVQFRTPAVDKPVGPDRAKLPNNQIDRYSPFLYAIAIADNSNQLALAWKYIDRAAQRYSKDSSAHELMCRLTTRWLRIVDSINAFDTSKDISNLSTVHDDLSLIIRESQSLLAESPPSTPKALRPVETWIGIAFIITLWAIVAVLANRFGTHTVATALVAAVIATFTIPIALWNIRLNRAKKLATESTEGNPTVTAIGRTLAADSDDRDDVPTDPTPPPQH